MPRAEEPSPVSGVNCPPRMGEQYWAVYRGKAGIVGFLNPECYVTEDPEKDREERESLTDTRRRLSV